MSVSQLSVSVFRTPALPGFQCVALQRTTVSIEGFSACTQAHPMQPVPQYHCSIACNHAITTEFAKTHSKTHIFTPIAALHAIMQYRCQHSCNTNANVHTFTEAKQDIITTNFMYFEMLYLYIHRYRC